jgi:hypothetical protein
MNQNSDRLEAVINDGYDFKFGEYISKGFNIFSRNAGLFVGYLFVYFAISLGLGIIPILGQLISFMISGALIAGFYVVADKTERGEYVQFSNFFDGFQSWAPLFVGAVLQVLLFLGFLIPFIFYFATKFGFAAFVDGEKPSIAAADFAIFGLLFLVLTYLGLAFIYMPFFVIFDKMEAWEAMKMSKKIVDQHIFMHILFFFVLGFIMIIGVLPLLLGLIVTIPATICALYAAWADITRYHEDVKENDDELLRHLID